MSVSIKEKMFFAEHLALMIKGGISLNEALEIIKKEVKSRSFKKALDDILKRILEGESLSKAMAFHPAIFDNFFRCIVKVGEESGTLEENLRYLALGLSKDYEMRNKIKGAMIYPLLVVLLAVGISLFITFFILPKITNLMALLNIDLPLSTKILISGAGFLQKNIIFIILGIVLFSVILKIIQRFKTVRFYLDNLSISLPLIGPIFRNLNLSRFSQIAYTLLKSGTPILETLQITSESMPNEVFKKDLFSIKSGVERGEKINQGLKKNPKTFPLIFSQMVLVGEKSGSLEESFIYLSNFYEKEVDAATRNLSAMLEPVLLFSVAVFVAFIAISIITPIFKFTGGLKFR